MADYVLKTGAAGAERLDVVESMFGDASRQFLATVGLRRGLRVLDVGCGSGTLTSWLAAVAGPEGHVTALDADAAQLEQARGRLAEAGLANVELVQGRAGETAVPEASYDLVHCRLVLMHLADPAAAVAWMARATRPGGFVACEETTATTAYTRPRVAAIERMNELFGALGRGRGLDFDIGDSLYALLARHAGPPVAARCVQPLLPLATTRRFLALSTRELEAAVLAAGLVDAAEAAALRVELDALPDDIAACYAPGRLTQVASRVDAAARG